MDDLRFSARRVGATVTVTINGDLDIATKPALLAFLVCTLQDGDHCVSLDLSGLAFIDAGGLGALICFQNRARKQGTNLVLANGSDRFRYLLRITRLDGQFELA
jgi:anti-sigma B factor antagonist